MQIHSTFPIYTADEGYSLLKKQLEHRTHYWVLCDQNTAKHCYPQFCNLFPNAELLIMPEGESSKSWTMAGQLLEKMLHAEADRNSVIIALGGGVVCDMAGFLASVYKRGIGLVHIPTSLLAMCDASVGGKTGVNADSGLKNMYGTFRPADLVIIDTNYLQTLPKRHWINAYAEMLKHGILTSHKQFSDISQCIIGINDWNDELLFQSIQTKAELVAEDPFEKGIRKRLNIGHTLGHAIEKFGQTVSKPYLHGEAIGIGLIIETGIAWKKQLCSRAFFVQILHACEPYLKRYSEQAPFETIWEDMLHDKKNTGNQVRMPLARNFGEMEDDVVCTFLEVQEVYQFIMQLQRDVSS